MQSSVTSILAYFPDCRHQRSWTGRKHPGKLSRGWPKRRVAGRL